MKLSEYGWRIADLPQFTQMFRDVNTVFALNDVPSEQAAKLWAGFLADDKQAWAVMQNMAGSVSAMYFRDDYSDLLEDNPYA